MDRRHVGRSVRAALSGGLTVAVLLGVVPAVAAQAAGTDCAVKNLTHVASFSSLQAGVDAATAGDTLQVRGRCVGGTTIDRNLRIVGKKTVTSGVPTLDGADLVRVVHTLEGTTVRIAGLTIRDGLATGSYPANSGGGIRNDGTLTLTNVVVRNSVGINGGGISTAGALTLNGTTAIHDNHADDNNGGGIDVDATERPASLVMNDTSSVGLNSAYAGGGVNVWKASLVLNDRARIHDNLAGYGGGINAGGSTGSVGLVALHDASSVDHNRALGGGSGITGETRWVMGGSSSIHDNRSKAIAGSGAVDLAGISFATTFTMKGSATVRDNVAGAGGAGIVIRLECGIVPVVSGAKARTSGNTPKNIRQVTGTSGC